MDGWMDGWMLEGRVNGMNGWVGAYAQEDEEAAQHPVVEKGLFFSGGGVLNLVRAAAFSPFVHAHTNVTHRHTVRQTDRQTDRDRKGRKTNRKRERTGYQTDRQTKTEKNTKKGLFLRTRYCRSARGPHSTSPSRMSRPKMEE